MIACPPSSEALAALSVLPGDLLAVFLPVFVEPAVAVMVITFQMFKIYGHMVGVNLPEGKILIFSSQHCGFTRVHSSGKR
jgi:hypothetical protein